MAKMTLDQFRTVRHSPSGRLARHPRRRGTGAQVRRRQHHQHLIYFGQDGSIGQTNYSAAKAGMAGLTKAAAREVARHGIRVNTIQPGLVRTPMTEALPQDI
jgi:3-oxoacyl-[acyl-carrier protein] reductase